MTTYRVKDWDRHFENDRSRTRDRCGFVCVPNKHGMGLSHVLTEPDGLAILGAFLLVIEKLSAQSRPRHGWLTDNGERTGRPWGVSDLAVTVGRGKRGEREFARLFEVAQRPNIAWLESIVTADSPPTPRQLPADSPGREGKGKEGKGKEGSAEPPAAAVAPAHAVPNELKGLVIYEADVKLCFDLPQMLPSWRQCYPGVDVLTEIRKAHTWELANPTKRKTPKGRLKFLNAWMDRAQNDGRNHGNGTGASRGGAQSGRLFTAATEQAGKFAGT